MARWTSAGRCQPVAVAGTELARNDKCPASARPGVFYSPSQQIAAHNSKQCLLMFNCLERVDSDLQREQICWNNGTVCNTVSKNSENCCLPQMLRGTAPFELRKRPSRGRIDSDVEVGIFRSHMIVWDTIVGTTDKNGEGGMGKFCKPHPRLCSPPTSPSSPSSLYRAVLSSLVICECVLASVRLLAGIAAKPGPTMRLCFAQMPPQLVDVTELHIALVAARVRSAVCGLVGTFHRILYLLRRLQGAPSARCLDSLWDDAVRRGISVGSRS